MKQQSPCRVVLHRAAILAVSLWLGGCVSHEGISLGTAPQGAEELIRTAQNETAAQSDEPAPATELILVGTVSSLRRFNERSSARYYNDYEEFAEELHPDTPPLLSLEQFQQTFAGWTQLKSFTMPLVMGIYRDVLIPASLAGDIYFPSNVGVFMVQEAGDLLAARTNADGFYVVDALLCRNGSGYYSCASEYDKGVFDARTGAQLNMSLVPARNGTRIDTASYKRMD